eukprot:5723838-Prymnesium_polylepis.1
MASSSKAAMTPLQNLVELQRSGLISAADFTRIAAELTKTDAERLAAARAEDDGQSSQGSPLVGEDGQPYDSGSPLAELGGGLGSSPALADEPLSPL